jgi:shikimate dehydrogenase
MKKSFGLVGKNISYSFSKGYFNEKFSALGLKNYSYENFDLQHIEEFENLIETHKDLRGLNVTIPYKEAVIPYLTELDAQATKIGAVNTIQFTPKGLKGFNTDAFGFEKSITPFLRSYDKKALILGTGGASKAIAFVLENLGISKTFVSRTPQKNQMGYLDLTSAVMKDFTVLINCTPLGTYPNIEKKPEIPYDMITDRHFLFDLIYNPAKTAFLKEGEKRGATITNGYRMLELQADRAWEIWHEQ